MPFERRWLAALLLALAGLLLAPVPDLAAHPVGNLSVNRYSRVEVHAERIRVRYVVDMAEIPTITELARLDSNHDGRVADEERSRYLEGRADLLAGGLSLAVDGAAVPLHVASSSLEIQPGEAGLRTFRLTMELEGTNPARPGEPATMVFRDGNYEPRIGWGEIVLRGGLGIRILESTAPETGLTDELRDYPSELLAAPPDRREAQATFQTGGAASDRADRSNSAMAGIPAGLGRVETIASPSPLDLATRGLASGVAALPRELAAGRIEGLGLLLALALAFLWGAGHALSPGHGKAVVGAYLVGSHGTARHALYLGLAVTASHTMGVYLLGLATLFAAQFILPDALYRWVALLSSLAVTALGLGLLLSRAWRLVATGQSHNRSHQHHRHHHIHEPDGHHHPSGESHGHGPHSHHHPCGDGHDHGHSHLPPGARGEPVTWRSLVGLGVAGGALPCPSALVLMLGAIAVGQVALGLALVAVFSAGLAAVLTAVGLAFVYAGRLLAGGGIARLGPARHLSRLAPIGSALAIAALGLAMSLEAMHRL